MGLDSNTEVDVLCERPDKCPPCKTPNFQFLGQDGHEQSCNLPTGSPQVEADDEDNLHPDHLASLEEPGQDETHPPGPPRLKPRGPRS